MAGTWKRHQDQVTIASGWLEDVTVAQWSNLSLPQAINQAKDRRLEKRDPSKLLQSVRSQDTTKRFNALLLVRSRIGKRTSLWQAESTFIRQWWYQYFDLVISLFMNKLISPAIDVSSQVNRRPRSIHSLAIAGPRWYIGRSRGSRCAGTEMSRHLAMT